MNEEKAILFVSQYAAGLQVSAEEKKVFREWLLSHSDVEMEQLLLQYSSILMEGEGELLPLQPEWISRLWQRIDSVQEKEAVDAIIIKRKTTWLRYGVAAALLFIIAAMTYLFFQPHIQQGVAHLKKQYNNDPAPGGAKATLVLADGTTVLLDNLQNGTVAKQGSITVIKLDSGQLVYRLPGTTTGNETADGRELTYNTLTTPKGGQYQLVLPDGSKVWLNAASSLRFPTRFTGKERRVELTGEGYFEVAAVSAMPFIVQANYFDVAVVGTHFNINAYSNEPYPAVTLLEGSVRVNKGAKSKILVPGQQATITANEVQLAVADVEEAVAWKNGLFRFSNANLKQVMRQLERWYNIEVNYNNIPDKHFYGIVSRYSNLSQVLNMLDVTGEVKFEMEGNQLKVLK